MEYSTFNARALSSLKVLGAKITEHKLLLLRKKTRERVSALIAIIRPNQIPCSSPCHTEE